ncbi:MAG TPA: M23 family metallopeptidase [Verrucomicrobiae bacterium]|nr:M23 family metallopeptidase [Verrucomicrobiae bacterium]
MKPAHRIGIFAAGWNERIAAILSLRWRMSALLLCGWAAGIASGAEPDRLLNLFTREGGGSTHFYAQNLAAGTVTTTFEMKLVNLAATTNFPYTTDLAANQTLEVFTLSPVKKDRVSRYRCMNSATLGSAAAVHDDAHVYDLPYAAGSAFRVSQGYHGAFSHSGPDEYAIDWAMPVGTPVCAAREGVVVKSKDDEDTGGPHRKFQSRANCILIEHSDGTIGIYGHLAKGGNKVKAGDRVKAGDEIGLSGKTGFVEGPHLHFAVFKTRNGSERVSLPVKFRTSDNQALTLASGREYRAPLSAEQVKDDAPVTTASRQKKPGSS